MFSSCIFTYDPAEKENLCLKIINHDNNPVYFLVTGADSLYHQKGILLYDLYMKEESGKTFVDTIFEARILPEDTSIVCLYGDLKSQLLADSNNSITIFYFDKALLEKYEWTIIAEQQYFMEKRKYTLTDLAATKWEINFP